jgi:hypothetical protein
MGQTTISGGIYRSVPIKEFTNNVSGVVFKGRPK